MADLNKMMMMANQNNGLGPDYRPRFGTNHQYPEPTTEDLIRLGLTGVGAGLGFANAAPWVALAGALGSKGYGPAAFLGANVAGGGMAGRYYGNEVAQAYGNQGDAQRQEGGFYGPVIPRFAGDAEAQVGGFYGEGDPYWQTQRRRDNAVDAQNQPGGFYGDPRRR